MTSHSADRQRRLRGAPLGLLLLGWGLGVGPVAHAVLAHGEPSVQDSADRAWVGHAGHGQGQKPLSPAPAHSHSPGGLEHLQLALFATVTCLAVTAVLLPGQPGLQRRWRAPLLRQWRRPEFPGAP